MEKEKTNIDLILEDVLQLLKEIVSNHAATLKSNLSKSLSLGRDIIYSGLDEETEPEDIEDVDSMIDNLVLDILSLVLDSLKGKVNINIDSNQDINIDNENLILLELLFEIEDDECEPCKPCDDELLNMELGCKKDILLELLFEIEDDEDIDLKDKILENDLILIEDDETYLIEDDLELDDLNLRLRQENKKYKLALDKLYESIKDVKMINFKMKYLNKILTLNKLSKVQQDKLIDLFDSVDTKEEVNKIYLTFTMSIKRKRQKALKESKKTDTKKHIKLQTAKPAENTIKEEKDTLNELLKVLSNVITLNQDKFSRIAQIAGIKK